MQILRIILIVCFAFTAYPSNAINLPDQILPVIPNYAERTMYQELQLEAKELDIEILKNRFQLLEKMTAPAGERGLENVEKWNGNRCAIEGMIESELTHLNERILQLQKKCIKLRKRFNKDLCRGDKECMTNIDECKSLKTQSKELDKSLDTPTEDDGY